MASGKLLFLVASYPMPYVIGPQVLATNSSVPRIASNAYTIEYALTSNFTTNNLIPMVDFAGPVMENEQVPQADYYY